MFELQAEVQATLKFSNGTEKKTTLRETFKLECLPIEYPSFDAFVAEYRKDLRRSRSDPEARQQLVDFNAWLSRYAEWDLSVVYLRYSHGNPIPQECKLSRC